MSTAKIPFVLAFTMSLRRCYTSPNPPPEESDRLKGQAFGSWYTQKFLPLFTAIDISVAALEIFIILMHYLNAAIPTHISQYLPFRTQLHNAASAIYMSPTTTIACLMMVTGALIRFSCFAALGKLFTFESSIQRDHRLVTSGPYAFVRHPSYMALLLVNPSWFLWHLGHGSFFNATFAARSWCGIVMMIVWGLSAMGAGPYLSFRRMHIEDKALKQKFGKEWDVYAHRVPYCLLPGVY